MLGIDNQKEQRLALSDFDDGVYFYSIQSSEGIIKSGKLVICKLN